MQKTLFLMLAKEFYWTLTCQIPFLLLQSMIIIQQNMIKYRLYLLNTTIEKEGMQLWKAH